MNSGSSAAAKRSLIGDDEDAIVMLLKMRLESAGYHTFSAFDGAGALKVVRELEPDLVLLDVMMPPPNGFEVCRVIKNDSALRKIPVILLTAKASETDQFWGSESGADAYIIKPYDPVELMNAIQKLISAEEKPL
ncbi:MAG: response regulator [Candidatus Omnitrophica bacterium]|nr:response regulator [Candidatus Omnitrophota bacterium]